MIDLSILVCAVPSRMTTTAPRLFADLCKQAEGRPVEVLSLFDNKRRTIGAKRNALLAAAQGRYLAFVDDDDRVAGDYVAAILAAVSEPPQVDVVTFDHLCTRNGGSEQLAQYSLKFRFRCTPKLWQDKPIHTCCWRAELAKRFAFPDASIREDVEWGDKVCEVARYERRIERVLYFYDFNEQLSESDRSEAERKGRLE